MHHIVSSPGGHMDTLEKKLDVSSPRVQYKRSGVLSLLKMTFTLDIFLEMTTMTVPLTASLNRRGETF